MLLPRSVRISVVGTGLIGGSIALGLKQRGYSVRAWDACSEVRTDVRNAGLDITNHLEDAIAGADLVVLATPVASLIETGKNVLEQINSAVVTDVGSVKAAISMELRQRYAATNHSFIPGHPMAGLPAQGFLNATPGLFEECTWVLCDQSEAAVVVEQLARALGATRVLKRTEDQHDHQVAVVSHLPQLTVTAVAATLNDPDLESVRNDTQVQEAMRLARSPLNMWSQITTMNSSAIRVAIQDAYRTFSRLVPSQQTATSHSCNTSAIIIAMSKLLYETALERELHDAGTLELAGPGFQRACAAREVSVDPAVFSEGLQIVRHALTRLETAIGDADALAALFAAAHRVALEIGV